ncbi:hypothetical protein PJN93_30305, partial [Mycobacterium kansasii]
ASPWCEWQRAERSVEPGVLGVPPARPRARPVLARLAAAAGARCTGQRTWLWVMPGGTQTPGANRRAETQVSAAPLRTAATTAGSAPVIAY